MKILISDAFDPSLPEKLAKYGEVTEDKAKLSEVDIVLVRSKTKCTKEYIDEAKNLKMIIRGGVGLDNIDLEYAKSKGIIVQNTAEASSIAVAELAMALLLAVASRVAEGDGQDRVRREIDRSGPLHLLRRKPQRRKEPQTPLRLSRMRKHKFATCLERTNTTAKRLRQMLKVQESPKPYCSPPAF